VRDSSSGGLFGKMVFYMCGLVVAAHGWGGAGQLGGKAGSEGASVALRHQPAWASSSTAAAQAAKQQPKHHMGEWRLRGQSALRAWRRGWQSSTIGPLLRLPSGAACRLLSQIAPLF